MDVDNGEQTKSFSSRNSLSSRSCRRNISSIDWNRVKQNPVVFLLCWSRYVFRFSCVIWTMCQSNLEFQRINPSAQVALFSRCSGDCFDLREIRWNIYRGEMNSSLNNVTQWILFNPTDRSSLFGKSFLPPIARSLVSFRSKDRRQVISRRQKIFSLRISMFVGDSKWSILFLEWTVRVRWMSKWILLLGMDLVQSHPRMEQQWHHSMFLVRIGLMKTKSKIILFTLARLILLDLLNGL